MRLGIVGAGGIAARHLSALEQDGGGGVTVVAHLGRGLERAAVAAARFGGTAYTDIDAFIAKGRPDVVLVTLPPAEHGPVERALMAARIPMLIEKPIGLNLATPLELAESIEASGLVAAAGYNWRALDTLDQVRELLAETPAQMVLGRFHIGTPATPWWRVHARSGGQMLEQACHLIDLARHLVGEGDMLGAAGSFARLPEFSDGDVAGTSTALLRFGGVPGVVTATCLLPGGPGAELRLICAGREIVITLAGVTVTTNGVATTLESRSSSYARQNRRFFEAVRTGKRDAVFCTYADAVRTHRLCLEITEAIGSA